MDICNVNSAFITLKIIPNSTSQSCSLVGDHNYSVHLYTWGETESWPVGVEDTVVSVEEDISIDVLGSPTN
jgi:hypothetical protein